jgi:hypothetical protein
MDICPASGALSAVNGKGSGNKVDAACAVSAQAAKHKPNRKKTLWRVIMNNRFMQRINFFTGSGRRGPRQDVKDDLVTEGYNVIETCMFKENVNVL